MLWHHNKYPIVGYFSTKSPFKHKSGEDYWLGITVKVKAYIWASFTCQHVQLLQQQLLESMEVLHKPSC
jgi:hypothetical protein